MRFKCVLPFLLAVLLLAVFAQYSTAQTITSNASGTQGGYHYEYWKDNGSGTMILGEGGNFSCTWDATNGNILFRKGLRPGVKNQVITYSADYKPNGNSYLTVYGWTKNPLIEYYIVDGWGSWRPPGGTSKGTVTSDGGTYDIYETTRTNAPSIEGTKTFQQYWSVRKEKTTSGTITCLNHFNAWENKGMNMGSFYEVAFNVEGYHSSGSADLTMSMSTGSTGIGGSSGGSSSKTIAVRARGTNGQGHITVTAGGAQTITFMTPANRYVLLKVYNCLGQEIATLGGREYSAGQHSVTFNASNLTSGVYLYAITAGD
jgi:endo-1,4-beta-xylanase